MRTSAATTRAFPVSFARVVAGAPFRFWLGEIRPGGSYVYLFTAGLSDLGPRTEVALVLPGPWALLNTYDADRSIYSFPIDLLERVAERVAGGARIEAGDLLAPADADLADLAWPEGVRYLIAVDQQWPEDTQAPGPRGGDDDITLLTLAPVTAKTFTPKRAADTHERLRTASPKRLALPYYWPERVPGLR